MLGVERAPVICCNLNEETAHSVLDAADAGIVVVFSFRFFSPVHFK